MFTKGFGKYVCEGDTIETEIDGFTVRATVYRDDCGDAPDERSECFWPSRDPKAAGYVLPESYDAEMALAQRVMDAWKNDEWFYCGVAVTVSRAGVTLTGRYDHALWGIECNYPDSDNSYLLDVANEHVVEALDAARASNCEIGYMAGKQDALLSKAAPAMLEALKALHACHRAFSSAPNWTMLDDEARGAAEAAIAAAEGE